MKTELVCDFCGEPNPTKTFAADNIPMPFNTLSVGAWMACEKCAPYIESHDPDGLCRHVIAHLTERFKDDGIDPDLIRWGVIESMKRFWKAKWPQVHTN